MKFGPIITSLLENDLYKFSMGQSIFHQASEYTTTWSFKCRNTDVVFTSEMVEEIREQIKYFCSLRFDDDELKYLSSIPWLKKSYINYLRFWRPDFKDFRIENTGDCGLVLETEGTWLNTSMYEIPTLAIVNEVYFRFQDNFDEIYLSSISKIDVKIRDINSGKYNLATFSEFGLRRRLCASTQDYVVKRLSIGLLRDAKRCNFIGTSNVYLAKKYNLKPVGTMAHEWIMCMGQGNHLFNPAYSNKVALDAWINEYGVENGIALTDTITTDCFLKDFDKPMATLFSGVRHDSGDPIAWGEKIIDHYKMLGIDPTSKTLLFSDSLDFDKATMIANHFKGKANVAFGIGTYLSNDTYVKPLNIVMKVTKCNGSDVAKISDTAGKGMCKNPEYVDYLQRSINWRIYGSIKATNKRSGKIMKKKLISVLIDKIGIDDFEQTTNTIRNKIIDSVQFVFERFENATIDKIHVMVNEIDGLRRDDVTEGSITGASFTFTLDIVDYESSDDFDDIDNDLEDAIIEVLKGDTSGIEQLAIDIRNPDCSNTKNID